jgi:ribosomal protein L4
MLSPERKEKLRSALLKIETPERRREVIRVAIKLVQAARRQRAGEERQAGSAPPNVEPPK